MLSRPVSDLVMLYTNVSDMCSTDFISLMSAVANVAVGAGGVMQYPHPCCVEEYFSRYITRLNAPRFAMMPVGQNLTVKFGNEEHETAYEGCLRRRKHWSGRRATDSYTHPFFMDMPFVYSVENAGYKTKFSELIGPLRAKYLVPTESTVSLWCGSDNFSNL